MSGASFEYVIYIHGSPEEVWDGLLDPRYTRRYWFHDNVSDWEPGSSWRHERTGHDEGGVDIVGTVLEADPPHHLVLSWALPAESGQAGKVSRVAFDMALQEEWPHGPWTGLSLRHTELEPGSEMLTSVSFGWPAVLSGLKSVLEQPAIFDAP